VKIGYPCINRTIGCQGNRTFRLKSYSENRLVETVTGNLDCLFRMLRYNAEHNLLFFRMTSDLVPFASHPVCRFEWRRHFAEAFNALGEFIRENDMRISMHPDQFVLINSLDEGVFERSVAELRYHAAVLDLLGLDGSARIQIHVGGLYGNREKSLERFAERFERLDKAIRRRLVVENDDVNYGIGDCLAIHEDTGVPVLFDVFHHQMRNNGASVGEAMALASRTWTAEDGIPMVDYSSQQAGARTGTHAESINLDDFRHFLTVLRPYDFDVMLEIKDKEESAVKAVLVASDDARFRRPSGKTPGIA
jgi:UV DNA damage endonuclease